MSIVDEELGYMTDTISSSLLRLFRLFKNIIVQL